jgi:hypothetical protein
MFTTDGVAIVVVASGWSKASCLFAVLGLLLLPVAKLHLLGQKADVHLLHVQMATWQQSNMLLADDCEYAQRCCKETSCLGANCWFRCEQMCKHLSPLRSMQCCRQAVCLVPVRFLSASACQVLLRLVLKAD